MLLSFLVREMTDKCQALAREAALSAEHMAIGVTALGKANYAQQAYYAQAFFALTIGIERACKLALVVNHALLHSGRFPTHGEVRKYGHNLKELLKEADQVATRLGLSSTKHTLPQSPIHAAIVDILSDFARNVTRYYNLDVVTSTQAVSSQHDPLHQWFDRVVEPIVKRHHNRRRFDRIESDARAINTLIANHTWVRHQSESGEPLESVYEASRKTGMTEFAEPYVRLYVMQIIRFVALLMSELGWRAQSQQIEDIPYLSEFYAIFNNEDKVFKKRKRWSIYAL